jgi:hypothetical protein
MHVCFNHTFVGNTQEQTDQALFHTWLEAVNLAFLDAYVNNKASAREWLESENVSQIVNDLLPEHENFPAWSYR